MVAILSVSGRVLVEISSAQGPYVPVRRFVQLPVVRLALTGATNPTGLVYLAFAYTQVTCQAAALP